MKAGFWQFIRFAVVGVLNTAFGYGIFAVIYLTCGSQTIAIVGGNIIGMIFNYFSIGILVFASKGGVAVRFLIAYGLILSANLGLAELLRNFGVTGLLAQLVLLPVLVILSYALNAGFVFRRAKRSTVVER